MRKQISSQVSVHWEGDGLLAIQDDRNGNLVLLNYDEAEELMSTIAQIIEERGQN
jgi:hypothetical protein